MKQRAIPAPLEFSEGVSERQAQILSAALTVFAEKGYDNGSMREIAGRVGVSEAALYRHFTGKEAIFRALIDALGAAIRKEGIPRLQAVRAETLESDLRELLLDRRQTVLRLEPALRVIVPVVIRNREWVDEMKQRVAEPVFTALLAKVAEIDMQLGVADSESTRAGRVRAMLSLFFGYLASAFVLQTEQDDAIVEALLRVMHWDQALTRQ